MKNLSKALSLGLFGTAVVASSFALTGCNFTVRYKEFSDNLNEAIAYIENHESYGEGFVKIDSTSYKCNIMPLVASEFKNDTTTYQEVNQLYDSMFAYTIQYIKDNAVILETPPHVEALTEAQENLYAQLVNQTAILKKSADAFAGDIANINQYYLNQDYYGQSSQEVFMVNYKKAYRNFIYDCFELANIIEDITASVYTKIDYAEDSQRTGEVFKVLEDGFNIRIFEGFFSFIVDSFDCRVPVLPVDANQYAEEILATYNSAKSQYINYYKSMRSIDRQEVSLSKEEIADIQKTMDIYFAETALYQKAYNDLNFVRFYFDDDCNLDRYALADYSNKNRYAKIDDYINHTLPNLTNYIATTFF